MAASSALGCKCQLKSASFEPRPRCYRDLDDAYELQQVDNGEPTKEQCG